MTLSFTRAVREELAHDEERTPCCRLAEVAGLVRTSGSFHIRGGTSEEDRYGLHLSTTVQPAARLAYSHFKAFGAEGRLLTRREPRLHRRLRLRGASGGHRPRCCRRSTSSGVLTDSFRSGPASPGGWYVARCCKAAFLRGCLLGAGSINRPVQEAHLEILTPQGRWRGDLVALLRGLDFAAGTYMRRGGSRRLPERPRQQVAELLAFAGAQRRGLACWRSSPSSRTCGPGRTAWPTATRPTPAAPARRPSAAAEGDRRLERAGSPRPRCPRPCATWPMLRRDPSLLQPDGALRREPRPQSLGPQPPVASLRRAAKDAAGARERLGWASVARRAPAGRRRADPCGPSAGCPR